MNRTTRIGLGTAAALGVLGGVGVMLWMAVLAQWQIVQAPGPASLAEAMTLVIVVVATMLGAWLAVSTLAAMLAHLPGRLGVAADRWAGAWAPATSRRVAAVLVGAALGGALAPGTALGDGPAAPLAGGLDLSPGFTSTATRHDAAEDSPSVDPAARSRMGSGVGARVGANGPGFTLTLPTPVESGPAPEADAAADPATARSGLAAGSAPAPAPAPGWTPSRPVQRPQPAAGLVTSGGESSRGADVVVHRGDTLWDVARRHLGPEATDAEVAHAWPAWHETNRSVIGDDPDVILPGQILRPPGPAASPQAQPSGAGR